MKQKTFRHVAFKDYSKAERFANENHGVVLDYDWEEYLINRFGDTIKDTTIVGIMATKEELESIGFKAKKLRGHQIFGA